MISKWNTYKVSVWNYRIIISIQKYVYADLFDNYIFYLGDKALQYVQVWISIKVGLFWASYYVVFWPIYELPTASVRQKQ